MFVIGATQAEAFESIRKLVPDHFFLVPGVGAQGGSLEAISKMAMTKDVGILVNVSRSIIYASAEVDFAEKQEMKPLLFNTKWKNTYLKPHTFKLSIMKKTVLLLLLSGLFISLHAQQESTEVSKANYQQAAKYSPARVNKMVFSTSVDPHWLKKSNRFWYSYQTTEGRNWYMVDPVKAEKRNYLTMINLRHSLPALSKTQ
jgi:hypothetical protein